MSNRKVSPKSLSSLSLSLSDSVRLLKIGYVAARVFTVAAVFFLEIELSQSSIRSIIFIVKVANGFNLWQAFSTQAGDGESGRGRIPFITFVLGGPGSGKGTQCTRIVETFGFTHLSAGDLLRKEISSDSENGSMILDTIKEGHIVPSEVTVKLIQKAIEASRNDRFLIDGFPRCEENRVAYERVIGTDPDIVLFFDCPEEEMVKRVLNRNEGRIDDNIDTFKERLKVFRALSLPVIKYYSGKGNLYKIDATGSEDEIFERVRPVFDALR